MSKFCSDPNKNAIFFIMNVLIKKTNFEYDKEENKDHIFSTFQIWQNLQFYRKILCKTTLMHAIRYSILMVQHLSVLQTCNILAQKSKCTVRSIVF